jgi:cell division initiation protein
MDINSDYIQKKEFHVVFKGYKPEEVDKFLDILSLEFEKLYKKNEELQESLDKLKFEGSGKDHDMGKVIQDALVSAHKIAEEIKQKAQDEADEIIKNRNIEEEQSFKELSLKKQDLEKRVKHIQDKYEDFKNRLGKTLGDFGEFMAKLDSSCEVDAEEAPGESSEDLQEDYDKEGAGGTEASMETDANEEESGNNPEEDKEDKEKVDYEEESQEEDTEDSGSKIGREKIDIANPDIIDEFFKADEG